MKSGLYGPDFFILCPLSALYLKKMSTFVMIWDTSILLERLRRTIRLDVS